MWYQLLPSLIIPAMLVLYSTLQDTTPASIEAAIASHNLTIGLRFAF
jgi:hypothetical protein